jgi:hypothetical protein
MERLSRLAEYLFLPPGPAGPVYRQYADSLYAGHAVLLAALVFFFIVGRTLNGRHGLKNWVLRRVLLVGGGVTLLGILLLALRPAGWPILSARILLAAELIALPALAAFLWWWLRNHYPLRLEAYEWEQRKKLYLPRAEGGPAERPKARARRRR